MARPLIITWRCVLHSLAGSLGRREKTAWRHLRACLTSGGDRDRKDWDRPSRDTYVGSRPEDISDLSEVSFGGSQVTIPWNKARKSQRPQR